MAFCKAPSRSDSKGQTHAISLPAILGLWYPSMFGRVVPPCGQDSAIEYGNVAAGGGTAQERALTFSSPSATIRDPFYDEPRGFSDSGSDLISGGKHWFL